MNMPNPAVNTQIKADLDLTACQATHIWLHEMSFVGGGGAVVTLG